MKSVYVVLAAIIVGGALGWGLAPKGPNTGLLGAQTLTVPTVSKVVAKNLAGYGASVTTTLVDVGSRHKIDVVNHLGATCWVGMTATMAIGEGYKMTTTIPMLSFATEPMFTNALYGYCEATTGTLVVIEYK